MTNLEITPEMVTALTTLRAGVNASGMDDARAQALVILDNAGVFKAIDAAALHGTARCTCPELTSRTGLHLTGCPGVTQ